MKIFHIDGSGMRPGGTGSGFAWVRIGTDEQRIYHVDGLTNNEAEYRALLSVLKHLAQGNSACIYTDSQLLCEQFNHRWSINDPKLVRLRDRAEELIEEKELEIDLKWIPRRANVAGKLLER